MDNKYDVIVVGAGNGGLVAAATCAKEGFKTLLLEKHNIPGGCATSFRRGRFEFEPSLHELCGVGTDENPDNVITIFNNLGAKVDWRYEKDCLRVILKGKKEGEIEYDVTLKATREGFLDSMEKAVPGCRESVAKLFALADTTNDALASMEGKDVPNILQLLTKYSDFIKCGSHSTEEVMNACGIPQKAQDILNTYWGYLGVPTDDLNGMHYISMVDSYVSSLPAMPFKRSHELSLAFCKVIYENGGDIWYNSEVTDLITEKLEDGSIKVIGVKVGDKELYAKEVISNVIPNNIFNMLGDRAPEKDRKLANARELGMSIFAVYLGMDCPMEDLKVTDYTVFVTTTPNAREQYNRGADGFYIVNCLNKVIPDCTEKGTCSLFFTMPMFDKDFPKDLKVEDYKKWKNDFALKYIKDYEKLMGIDILSHIEEISIATPVTFARYLNTPKGEIYGYQNLGWDNVLLRSVFNNIGLDNSIKGLTYVGGHAQMGDGYSSAYTTGRDNGNKVVKRLKEENK